MARNKEKSAAIQLLDLVWINANKATEHSWQRLNWAMRDALRLAIESGIEFFQDDFSHIIGAYRTDRWIGDSHEWVYSTAISHGNTSAIRSYEKHLDRLPIIADGVTIGRALSRLQERLCVGACFDWKGRQVEVTSFSKDQTGVIACSYRVDDQDRKKVEKRFRITRGDIIADRAERKERDALMEELTKVADKHNNAQAIMKALGISSPKEWSALPLKKIRKVAEQFGVQAA